MRSTISLILFLAACGSPSDPSADTDGIDTDDTTDTDDTGNTTDTDDTGVVPPLDVDDDNDGFTENEGDCNDGQPAINPMATDIVGDEIDQNCDGADGFDGDGDGHADEASGGDDCDDDDNFTFPGAIEIWYDNVDQGCLGDDWPGDYDQDGDGFDAEGVGGDDCLDTNAAVNPDPLSFEMNGNGLDDNCNGTVDGLRVTMAWNPTNPVFTFEFSDLNGTGSLTLLSANMTTAEMVWSTHTMSGASISLNANETVLEDEYTTLTYIYSGTGLFGVLDDSCIIWGARVAEYMALGPTDSEGELCIEADPTTW